MFRSFAGSLLSFSHHLAIFFININTETLRHLRIDPSLRPALLLSCLLQADRRAETETSDILDSAVQIHSGRPTIILSDVDGILNAAPAPAPVQLSPARTEHFGAAQDRRCPNNKIDFSLTRMFLAVP